MAIDSPEAKTPRSANVRPWRVLHGVAPDPVHPFDLDGAFVCPHCRAKHDRGPHDGWALFLCRACGRTTKVGDELARERGHGRDYVVRNLFLPCPPAEYVDHDKTRPCAC